MIDYPLGPGRSTVKCIFSCKQKNAKIQVISLPKISEFGTLMNILFSHWKFSENISHIQWKDFRDVFQTLHIPISKSGFESWFSSFSNNSDFLLVKHLAAKAFSMTIFGVWSYWKKGFSWSFYINVYKIYFYNVCCGHVITFYKEILKDRGKMYFKKPSLTYPPHVFLPT